MPNNTNVPNDSTLRTEARALRADLVALSHRTRTSHLGSALSCVDILVAAYHGGLNISPEQAYAPDRDRLILSKGHAAAALYLALGRRGYFNPKDLNSIFNCDGGKLQEHPGPGCLPGVEAAAGSLGHGLSIGLGMALGARIRGQKWRTCVVMSDGECNEGSVWEAAMLAGAQHTGNLCAIIDFNRWQATGRSCEVMAIEPFGEKWAAFGWSVLELDGHDPLELRNAMIRHKEPANRPLAIIAHTVKGKGISFMEDDNNWHYRIPSAEEVRKAHQELLQP